MVYYVKVNLKGSFTQGAFLYLYTWEALATPQSASLTAEGELTEGQERPPWGAPINMGAFGFLLISDLITTTVA